jgi:hypothetical protein
MRLGNWKRRGASKQTSSFTPGPGPGSGPTHVLLIPSDPLVEVYLPTNATQLTPTIHPHPQAFSSTLPLPLPLTANWRLGHAAATVSGEIPALYTTSGDLCDPSPVYRTGLPSLLHPLATRPSPRPAARGTPHRRPPATGTRIRPRPPASCTRTSPPPLVLDLQEPAAGRLNTRRSEPPRTRPRGQVQTA